ncbi:hypothetical protein mRhiFer1_009670 [Rhinolophus ferrumequinum]|uniref:Transcription initiation factor TFIID subunit 8 n=1 Tax=Rhinolophus ferrumequinum TaxID=59479 RepID=A0A7J7R3A5_RHIFE|nr:hypothetical protein mRhiFer1_009670 [Rhinolophus ferrumequinum]
MVITASPVTIQPVTPKTLVAGQNRPHPTHIPSHFPEFPDPHTYIKTPMCREPVRDYQIEQDEQTDTENLPFHISTEDSGAEKENTSVLQQNPSLPGSRNGEENIIGNAYLRPMKKSKSGRKESLS